MRIMEQLPGGQRYSYEPSSLNPHLTERVSYSK